MIVPVIVAVSPFLYPGVLGLLLQVPTSLNTANNPLDVFVKCFVVPIHEVRQCCHSKNQWVLVVVVVVVAAVVAVVVAVAVVVVLGQEQQRKMAVDRYHKY